MQTTHLANLVLWSVQGFLAFFFLLVGAPKIIGRGIDRWTGFSDVPRPMVVIIGLAEVFGAAGLVVPMATGMLPWLTPLAGVGLALIVVMATGFHLRADERLQALETALWAGTASALAIGRWRLVQSAVHVAPLAVVWVLSVLVPAVVINIIVLLRRSVP
jgi:hypothetical protein